MKPQQLEFRVDPNDGLIWAVRVQRGKPVQRLKNVTDELLLCLCADLSADGAAKEIDRSVRFSDGMVCRVTVTMEQPPNLELRAQEVAAFEGVNKA